MKKIMLVGISEAFMPNMGIFSRGQVIQVEDKLADSLLAQTGMWKEFVEGKQELTEEKKQIKKEEVK